MKSTVLYCVVCLIAVCSVNSTNAATISIAPGNAMEATDLAGAPGVRVNNWNNWNYNNWVLGDNENVIDDSGVTVDGFSVELSAWPVSGRWKDENTSSEDDAAMFKGVFDVFGSNWTVTASGIPYDYWSAPLKLCHLV